MADYLIKVTEQDIAQHAPELFKLPPPICEEHTLYDVESWSFTWSEPGVFDFNSFTAWCVECDGIRFVKPGDPVRLNIEPERLDSLAANLRERNRPGHEDVIAAVTEMVA